MPDEYTPTTDEVRSEFARQGTIHAFYDPRWREEMALGEAAFDRWRAADHREVAARTLREAADRYRSGQITGVFPSREEYTRSWLHAEADRIEKGDADAE